MRREHGCRAVLFVVLWTVAASAAARPAAAGPVQAAGPSEDAIHAELGIGGWIALGRTIPLRIDLRTQAPLSGTLQVDVPAELRGGAPTTHRQMLSLPPGGRFQAHLDVVVHDPRRPLIITARDGRGVRLRSEVSPGVRRVVEGVVAALTREAAGLEFVAGGERKRQAAYLGEAELPVRWQAYDLVDLLIIRDLDPRAVAPAQQGALVEWIAQGGRLLVVAPRRLHKDEAAWLRALLPRAGWRRYGLGTVAVHGEDLFAPAARARGSLRAEVTALLERPAAPALEVAAAADLLPATRPLSGTAQGALAALSLLYVLGVRATLRRVPARRIGWLGLAGLIAASTGALYGIAAEARTAATSLAQLSVAEMLGDLPAARVVTYASVIAPYGGGFTVRVPEGVTARAADDAGVRHEAGGRELRGAAADGQALITARQIVPLRLRVRQTADGAVAVESGDAALRGAVLYRRRHVYRLPPGVRGVVRIDPARWEPVDRVGLLGLDLAGRAAERLFHRLDRDPGAMWLVGRIDDERMGLRTARGDPGDAVRLIVAEVR